MDPREYENKMSLDTQTGKYEGEIRIKVTVDAEFVQREMNRIISESPGLDLMDAKALESIRAKLADPFYWKDKPQAKVDTMGSSPSQEKMEKSPPPASSSITKRVTKKQQAKDEMRDLAREVAPHLWEKQCLTPLGDTTCTTKEERYDINQRRALDRQVLEELYDEWKRGEFLLSEEAAEQERLHQETERRGLSQKLEVIATTVNGSGFH